MSEAEVEKIVEARLLEEKLITPPAEASPERQGGGDAGAGTPSPKLDPAAESLAFLAQLDELMAGYEPQLPQVDDQSDLLRCVTEDALKNDPALKGASRALAKKRRASTDAREKAKREFQEEVVPLHYRLDFGWESRTDPKSAVYGCWGWSGERDKWLTYDDASAVSLRKKGYISRQDCDDVRLGVDDKARWKIREPGEKLYADGPPELMKRIEATNTSVPSRFSCRVMDVEPRGSLRWISCGHGTTIRISGESPPLNIGDLVSAPLRDVQADPDGVLAKLDGNWVVTAEGSTLTVDEAASCPTVEEILAAVGGR